MTVTVPLEGELDLAGIEDMRAALEPAAVQAGEGGVDLVLDMTGVTFLDSSGLATMVRIRRLLPEGSALVLHGCRPSVRRVLDISGMAHLCDDEPEAGEAAS